MHLVNNTLYFGFNYLLISGQLWEKITGAVEEAGSFNYLLISGGDVPVPYDFVKV